MLNKQNLKNSELWKRLQEFNIDEPGSSFTLTQRLARENGWSIDYATRVIIEYKKFLYLAMISNTSVTPSDEVDQAWHLHMLYTESYWDELCGNVLGREIGHGPTKGGNSEKVKYNDQYNSTLELYKLEFGVDAPFDIWPSAERRFANVNYQRVNMVDNIVLKKSKVKEYMALYVIAPILILVSIILMSAEDNSSDDENFGKGLLIIILIIVGIFIIRGIWRYINRNNRGGGSGGSSSSGCGCSIAGSFFGCSSDSGCSSSGCGSSGCGGCGGCGD